MAARALRLVVLALFPAVALSLSSPDGSADSGSASASSSASSRSPATTQDLQSLKECKLLQDEYNLEFGRSWGTMPADVTTRYSSVLQCKRFDAALFDAKKYGNTRVPANLVPGASSNDAASGASSESISASSAPSGAAQSSPESSVPSLSRRDTSPPPEDEFAASEEATYPTTSSAGKANSANSGVANSEESQAALLLDHQNDLRANQVKIAALVQKQQETDRAWNNAAADNLAMSKLREERRLKMDALQALEEEIEASSAKKSERGKRVGRDQTDTKHGEVGQASRKHASMTDLRKPLLQSRLSSVSTISKVDR